MTDIKVPVLPESVQDATIANWSVADGTFVREGEVICELETDKIMLEVTAVSDGVLRHVRAEGDVVAAQALIGRLEVKEEGEKSVAQLTSSDAGAQAQFDGRVGVSPSARKVLLEKGLESSLITGTGSHGRVLKQDVMAHDGKVDRLDSLTASTLSEQVVGEDAASSRISKRVPMTRMRARIAERLMQSQKETASLTTFNEVDMSAVMALRSRYKDAFAKKYDVKLSFMSFFLKSVTYALRCYPEVNASIDGEDVVYHGYCDVGVAVSTDKGLLVPIIRDCERLSVFEIESTVLEYAKKARSGGIRLEDLQGGTFSITNGGVFGSILSTPILNPPQSAILGMHNIVERAVVVNGQVVARPVMYLALTYDHRLIDGKQAVQFLVEIKNMIEDPMRLLIEA